jgi:hypothetical protein
MANDELDVLAPPPDWQPDADAARRRFAERARHPRASHRLLMPAATLAAIGLATVLISSDMRLAAQQMWQWITVGRIEVVRLNVDNLPDEARTLFAQQLGEVDPPRPAATVDEAASLAGFAPRLPPAGTIPGDPKFSVTSPSIHATVIRVANVEVALRKAGVTDQVVPRAWDGAKIELRLGTAVFTEWPGMTLIQGLPPTITASAGLDIAEFGTVILRALGMPRNAAERFGRRMRETPSVLCGIGIDDQATISEVKLRHGYGTLIENFGADGKVEYVELLWGTGDRLYAFSGATTVDIAKSIADSVE